MVKILPELQALIPPQTQSENDSLRRSILQNGCRDPLVLWDDVLIDGHHRYAICTENNIPFNTVSMEFESIDNVKLWMIDNQLSRRNLAAAQRIAIAYHQLEIEQRLAKQRKGKAGGGRGDSREICAQVAGVSHYVFDQGVKILTCRDEFRHVRQAWLTERISTNKAHRILALLEALQSDVCQEIIEQKLLDPVEISNFVIKRELQMKTNTHSGDRFESPNFGVIANIAAFESSRLLGSQSVDLLLTDPPRSSEVDNFGVFLAEWLYVVLNTVKDTGRAVIFGDSSPFDVQLYLNKLVNHPRLILENIGIWTHKNVTRPSSKHQLTNNYQVYYCLRGEKARPFQNDLRLASVTFSAPEINRLGAYQKPDELAIYLIDLMSKPDEVVFDPFAGSGTFGINALKMGRNSYNSEIEFETFEIALERGLAVWDTKQI